MTTFDIIALIIFLAFLARGIWTGLIHQLTFLAALLLGFLAAGRLHSLSAHMLESFITNRQLNFLVTYVLLFVVAYLLVMLLGKGLKKVMSITFLGWFDRLLGGLFGIIKAVFIASLIFMIVNAFLSGTNNGLKNSLSYPFFIESSQTILMVVKDKKLRDQFLPKKPAILPDLLFSPITVPGGKAVRGNAQEISKNDHLIQ